MKRQRLDKTVSKYARFGDIQFPRENPLADYDSTWTKNFTDRTLITVTQCWESTVLFSARQGWINSKSTPFPLRERSIFRHCLLFVRNSVM